MRRRWARAATAALLLAACARNGPGTAPPPTDEPPMTASATPEAAPAPAAVPTDAATAPPSDPTPPEPQPPSSEGSLPPPTAEEFRAWDRRDPEQEAKLDAWDRANLQRLLRSFDELRCFHQAVRREGERFMADASREPEWFQHKQRTILALDEWLKRFFADNPRVLEKSRLVGHFLEAHELVMFTYPKAYTARDRAELDRCDEHWQAVESKVRSRATALGGALSPAPTRCEPPVKR